MAKRNPDQGQDDTEAAAPLTPEEQRQAVQQAREERENLNRQYREDSDDQQLVAEGADAEGLIQTGMAALGVVPLQDGGVRRSDLRPFTPLGGDPARATDGPRGSW
jgi:hypothetical protein